MRTRGLMLLMRAVPSPRLAGWRGHRRAGPLLGRLVRGDVQVTGGIGVRLRLSATSVPPWGAQSYGMLAGVHETGVQEALRRHLGPGDTLWDVGANTGFVSLVGARLVGPGGTVVAIEPDPDCAAAVRANAARNGLDGVVRVVEGAATAADGPVELIVVRDPLWNRVGSVGEHELETARRTVAGIALDGLDGAPPTVVKLDVEGGELDALRGMGRVLREARPVVVCELHGTNAAFCALMERAGYVVMNLDGPEPVAEGGGNIHALALPDEAVRRPASRTR